MTKKKKSDWDKYIWILPATGIIALIGATMNVFGVPYGYEIGISGAMWFSASFIVALLYVAAKEDQKEKKVKRK